MRSSPPRSSTYLCLVDIPGGPWVGVLEADLTDYSGMYVGGVAGLEYALLSKLSPNPRAHGPGGDRLHAQEHPVAGSPDQLAARRR